MNQKLVALQGSQRTALGTRIGEVPRDEVITVSVILKPKARAPIPGPGEPVLSREQFAESYGADPDAVEKIKQFAAANHLTVAEVLPASRTVKLQGTVEALTKAFGATLHRYEHQGRQYRARTGMVHVPQDVEPSIEAVLGLDDRPQAEAHFRILEVSAAAASISYNPPQVAVLYDFPPGATGAGQTIGIIELGGGFNATDLKNYFSAIDVDEPSITSVSVDNAENSPTTPDSADGEVLLDIEVAGSVAPGAKIVVYFAPNTDAGFLDALTTAIHDTANAPSVISISWGGPESTWTAQAMTAFDSAAQDAAALGVTICAASGDNGSSDGVTDGANHVDFPASSPHILACGGTSLRGTGTKIASETVWNDGTSGGAGGGGFSIQFPLPSYQTEANITGTGRGVPDVSGDADPQTGYNVLVDGQNLVIGGTSAVAPLWSGLIALLNEQLGAPVGFLQPKIYALPSSSGAFHDITSGNNGAFDAAPGWDPASGLGSPSGENLLKAL
jgi:kumamolisin